MHRLTSASYVKILLIVLLFLGVFAGFRGIGSLAAAATSATFGIFNSVYQNRHAGTPYESGSGSVLANTITSIDISWAAGTVRIVAVPDEQYAQTGDKFITLTEDNKGGTPVRWYSTGYGLVVEYGFSGGLIGCTPFATAHKDLLIEVPQSVADGLELVTVNAASGNYILEGLTCEAIDFDLASGEVTIDGVTANTFTLDMASGTAGLAMNVKDHAEFSIASGQCRWATGIAPSSVHASLMSGNLTIGIPSDAGFDLTLAKASGGLHLPSDTYQRDDRYVYRPSIDRSVGDDDQAERADGSDIVERLESSAADIIDMDIDMASGDLTISPQ